MNLTQNHRGVLCRTIVLGFLALISSAEAQAGFHLDLEAQRVPWSQLSFQAKNFWVEVSTEIQIRYLRTSALDALLLASPKGIPIKPKKSQINEMTVNTIIDPRFRPPVKIHNRIWFNPTDVSAMGRIRLRRGDDHFKKMYRFTDQGVFRHRIEPKNDKEATLGPERWTDIKNSFYPYDLTRTGCSFVSERSLLVFILSAVDFSMNNEPLSLCVFGKRQLHRVKLQAQGLHPLNVNYIEKTQGATIRKQGTINTLKIAITAEPMDSGLKEPENFSFLGFHNNIVIYIQPAAGLPIQAEGIIPTIGKAQLKLNEVKWRPKSE
jgi:hypothetical protein